MPINYYAVVFTVTVIVGVGLLFSLPFGARRAWLWALLGLPWAAEVLPIEDTLITLPTDMIAGTVGIALLGYLLLFSPHTLKAAWGESRLFRWICFYLLWMGVTVPFSQDTWVSLKFWMSQSAYAVTFGLSAYLWATPEHTSELARVYARWVLPSALLVLAVCVIEHLILGGVSSAVERATKPFMREHTVYGAYSAWFFVGAMVLFFARHTFWGGVAVGVSGAALILSYSRGGWLSAVGALGLLGAIQVFRRLSPVGRLVAAGTTGVVGLLGIVALIQYNPQILQQRAYQQGGELGKHLVSSFDVKQNASNLERVNRWFAALQMIEERPWLGFGPNTFAQEYSAYQRTLTRTSISVELGEVGGAHSEYLTAASEMGLPGLVLLLGIYFLSLKIGLAGFRRASTSTQRWQYALLVFPLVSYYLHGFINNFMDHGHMAGLVYLHWGWLAALEREAVLSPYATTSVAKPSL